MSKGISWNDTRDLSDSWQEVYDEIDDLVFPYTVVLGFVAVVSLSGLASSQI